MIKSILKSRSFQIIALIGLYLLTAQYLPLVVHQGLYTISLLIKDLLLYILPLSVGFFIGYAISSFEKKALLFVLTLFFFELLSNCTSVFYAYGCGHIALSTLSLIEPQAISDQFEPLFRLANFRPTFFSADKGSFAGILLGLIATLSFPLLRQFLKKGKESAEWVLTRCFAQLIPLFVLGFVARMYQTKLLQQLGAQYADLLIFLILFLASYIAMIFLIGSNFSYVTSIRSIKNLLPAGSISFSSGCSLSTMPWTIEGTAKNLRDPHLAKAVIPATTNIQQIGDCIANSFLAFLIYSHFFGTPPSLSVWIPFTVVFVLARFATAAVIGGAIFIMLPIYEAYLNFTPEMIAIILAFNVILDPLITCSNVMANGALCRIFENVWSTICREQNSDLSIKKEL